MFGKNQSIEFQDFQRRFFPFKIFVKNEIKINKYGLNYHRHTFQIIVLRILMCSLWK